MIEKKKKSGVWGKVAVLLLIVVAIISSGIVFIDKVIVPSYFSSYGIDGTGDVLKVITTLYGTPKEHKIVTHGFSDDELTSALQKLDSAGFEIGEPNEIFATGFNQNAGEVSLSDKEFAAICNKMITSQVLSEKLSVLEVFNLERLTLLEVKVDGNEESLQNDVYKKAKVSFVVRADTGDVKNTISKLMKTPKSLLDMIMPGAFYFSVSYDIDFENQNNISNKTIGINGKSAADSEILSNMLIDFIYEPEKEMNIEKLIEGLNNILLETAGQLGEISVKKISGQTILNFR